MAQSRAQVHVLLGDVLGAHVAAQHRADVADALEHRVVVAHRDLDGDRPAGDALVVGGRLQIQHPATVAPGEPGDLAVGRLEGIAIAHRHRPLADQPPLRVGLLQLAEFGGGLRLHRGRDVGGVVALGGDAPAGGLGGSLGGRGGSLGLGLGGPAGVHRGVAAAGGDALESDLPRAGGEHEPTRDGQRDEQAGDHPPPPARQRAEQQGGAGHGGPPEVGVASSTPATTTRVPSTGLRRRGALSWSREAGRTRTATSCRAGPTDRGDAPPRPAGSRPRSAAPAVRRG